MNETSELRHQLLEASLEYKEEIREGLQTILTKLGKTGVNALIISGSLVTSYLLYRAIVGSRATKFKKDADGIDEKYLSGEPSIIDKLADKVLEQMLLFLLTLAKEKLVEYLKEQKKDNDGAQVISEKA